MPETITLHALDLSGETALKLFLRKDDGTLLNTGGDALAEIGSSGVFTATLAESRSGLGDLSYRVCDGTETADNLLIDGFLPETETTIGASGTAILATDVRVKLDATQPDYAPATSSALSTTYALLQLTDADVASIQSRLPSDPADQSAVEAAITAATSPLATPAQVNAQVLDVLSVDTFDELSAPPAATSSLKDKITWLFMYARNKVTQTALARTLYRDDSTTVAGTSETSDNGTVFTKGKDT